MEAILLGLVVILCIYILYCIFTPGKEGFRMLTMSDSEENRLGAIAARINSPINWDTPGNNPTNLIATAASPISKQSITAIKNTYHTALGNPNTGPRIDDNNSLLYTIDFCYQGAKASNPFSDPAFANSCGICMTQGTLINGTSGSNLGVVVFPEDRAYSLSQGTDAVPSSHSATCAPIVKTAGSSSNIRSVVVNSEQYTATKTYMQSNFYTIDGGSGAGEKNVRCSGSSNGHNFVIKQGAYRDGIWDSHVAGAPIDYSRKNLLTTTPFPSTCIEQSNCVFTTSSLQWDSASLCGYPKPTPITSLGVDSTQTTATSLTFVWTGGEYADNAQYSLVKRSDSSTVPGIQATLNLAGNSVKYIGLTANTVYIFSLTVSNASGIAQGSYTKAGFKNFVEGFFDMVTGQVEGKTADDRDKVSNLAITNQMQTSFSVSWTGGKNASSITVSLSDRNTNTQIQSLQIAPGVTVCPFTDLVAGKTYTVMVTATYDNGPSVSISGTAETTAPPLAVHAQSDLDTSSIKPPQQLIKVNNPGVSNIRSIVTSFDGSTIITIAFGSINISFDKGNTWISGSPAGINTNYFNIAGSSTLQTLIMSTYGGPVYISLNGGSSWTTVSAKGVNGFPAVTCTPDGNTMYIACEGGGVYKSSNSGMLWSETLIPISGQAWRSITCSSDAKYVLAVSYNMGVYVSTDSGASWIKAMVPTSEMWQSCICSNDGSLMGISSGSGKISTSSDYGLSWINANMRLPRGWNGIMSLQSSYDGRVLVASSWPGALTVSTDRGITWKFSEVSPLIHGYVSVSPDGTFVIVANFYSTDMYTYSLVNSV